jgi:hypothetical protein
MAVGTGVAVPVLRYEDPDCQAVHQSIHHAAVSQALTRARQVLRTAVNPVTVLQFGNVPTDRPVDVIIRWQDAKPDRLVHMVDRGRVPLNAADMAAWHPTLFPTEKAAFSARERFGDVRIRILRMIRRQKRPWSIVRYQPAGQGQQIHASLFCPTDQVDQVRAEAERLHPAGIVQWTVGAVTDGRGEGISTALLFDLTALGMSSRPVPEIRAAASPWPPAICDQSLEMAFEAPDG